MLMSEVLWTDKDSVIAYCQQMNQKCMKEMRSAVVKFADRPNFNIVFDAYLNATHPNYHKYQDVEIIWRPKS